MAFEQIGKTLKWAENLFGGSSGSEPNHSLRRFSDGRDRTGSATLGFEDYRRYWRELLSGGSEKIYPNGWAFSTFAGTAHYEHRVTSDSWLKQYYASMPGGWGETATRILQAAKDVDRKVGGVIVYGHGNLEQESHIALSLFAKEPRIASWPWYLLDCSLPYHLYACSSYSRLSNKVSKINRQSIKPVLIDFMSKDIAGNLDSGAALTWIRERFGAYNTVVHFHIGNTVCNTLSEQMDRVVPRGSQSNSSRWFKQHDILVIEYMQYLVPDKKSDAIEEMARRSAAEIFEVAEQDILIEWVAHPDLTDAHSVLKITAGSASFYSMLRRNFDIAAYTAIDYTLIGNVKLVDNQAGALYVAILQKK